MPSFNLPTFSFIHVFTGHADMTKNDKKPEFDYLNKWEQSLLASTSFSQVFLHYGTLDSCVMWSRSVLLARCRICRRQKDSENMLLCDNCNLGHHLYCLKPKLTVSTDNLMEFQHPQIIGYCLFVKMYVVGIAHGL